MKFKILLIFLMIAALPGKQFASNLKIENVIFHDYRSSGGAAEIEMLISWDNAWKNNKNYDAAWVFIKFQIGEDGYRHAKIAEEGHKVRAVIKGVDGIIEAPSDGAGFFIYPAKNYRGALSWKVSINLDPASLERIPLRAAQATAYGIEMVYIPSGSFTLGDPDSTALKFGAFYQSDENGKPERLFTIEKEKQIIEIGPERGKLYYQAENQDYQGDQKGPVPAEFPKGVQGFYIMKYEVQQGAYTTFLNSISGDQSHIRANFSGKTYQKYRGSIYLENGVYKTEQPSRPCNFISWDDGLAFADWAGLRPMTEFEFTKACRGTSTPVAHEYPWGSGNTDQLLRYIDDSDNLVLAHGTIESDLNDENKAVFGASYYWVMDLAGSVWERVITVGDEKGRAFTGQHGDGNINHYGYANVSDWPSGDREPGGYGFRGGGYYKHGHNFNEFLPHSPIAYRTYGAWSGGYRTKAYSNRYVRTKM